MQRSPLPSGWAGAAHAENFGIERLVPADAALVQSLVGGERAADREVIAPPAHLDPQMALAPPQARGTMRIIKPPTDPEQH